MNDIGLTKELERFQSEAIALAREWMFLWFARVVDDPESAVGPLTTLLTAVRLSGRVEAEAVVHDLEARLANREALLNAHVSVSAAQRARIKELEAALRALEGSEPLTDAEVEYGRQAAARLEKRR